MTVFRTSCIDTTSAKPMMGSVAKKERSVSARSGQFTRRFSLDFFVPMPIRCVEALTRAGEFEKPLLYRAVSMFEVRGRVFWLTMPLKM